VQGRGGGLFANNFYGRNAVAQGIGYKEEPLPSGQEGHVVDAVASEGSSMYKGATQFDIDFDGDNQRTGAIYGLVCDVIDVAPGAIVSIVNSIASQMSPEWIIPTPTMTRGANRAGIDFNGTGPEIDCIEVNWDTPSQGNGPAYLDQTRTLGTYKNLVETEGKIDNLVTTGYITELPTGYDDFDVFMNIVLNRQLGKWDDEFSAGAINNYIRVGLNKSPIPF